MGGYGVSSLKNQVTNKCPINIANVIFFYTPFQQGTVNK